MITSLAIPRSIALVDSFVPFRSFQCPLQPGEVNRPCQRLLWELGIVRKRIFVPSRLTLIGRQPSGARLL